MLREYTVFNVDQCEGLPERVMAQGPIKVGNGDERDPAIDEFLTCSGGAIREGSSEAYYRTGDEGWRSTSWGVGPGISRGLTVICDPVSGSAHMRRRNWSPS
jgi:hypothetical protein